MRLGWRKEALDDLDRIFEFNLERSEALAAKLERRLRERAQAITLSPYLGRPLQDVGMRRLSVTDIQYVIDYELAEDSVLIVRIRHTR
ncbi:MAG TPA: type II toxin-antitoxin system RelE/ParE family toxin, partial [Allosphingosinicella sp.]|nr:type II toxin-antitoxin system RelE/ParE family toxin [Allosphingosinicella sp.]